MRCAALAWAALACAAALPACATAPARPATPAPAPAAARDVPVPPPPRASALKERGRALFAEAAQAGSAGDPSGKAPDWEALGRRWQAAAEGGDLPESWFNLGVCRLRQDRRGEAATAFGRALELQPLFGEAASSLALLAEPADARSATLQWTQLLRRFPEDALARARLAALAERAGQQEEALRLAREALLRDPHQVGAVKVMMRVALARKQLDLAHLLALRAEKLDPADPEIPTAVGGILLQRGDEPGAQAQWRRALKLREDWLPARGELLRLELSRQRWPGAAEQARALLQASPRDASAQLALGIALRHLGEPAKAAEAYDAAERLSGGKLAEVHLARGVLLARVEERCEPALAELRRYAQAGGPGVLADGTVRKLEKECDEQLAASRAAEEEVRRMKAAAGKKDAPASPPDPARRPGP